MSRDRDNLQAEIQELVDLVRGLKQRVESRHDQAERDRQNLRQLFARWEQEDGRSEEPGRNAQFEEHERRMKEQDARIEANMRDIHRRLDDMERQRDEGSDAGETPQER